MDPRDAEPALAVLVARAVLAEASLTSGSAARDEREG
jgi:hypothetical protein